MAHNIRKVGVIGAGQMGNGIAHVAAQSGIAVTLIDVSAGCRTLVFEASSATIYGDSPVPS